MASKAKKGGAAAPSTPIQPGLRRFIIYDRVPEGCLPHFVQRDECEPRVRAGETAVIDPREREPVKGELFLIQWTSGTQRRQLAELMPVPSYMTLLDANGKPDRSPHWFIGGTKPQPLVSLAGTPVLDDDGRPIQPVRWVDGPYPAVEVDKRLIGRVVGILGCRFEEPKRLGSAVHG